MKPPTSDCFVKISFFMSKQKAIEEIGARLLRGHKMLAESCPEGCNCPLMESNAGIQCVACEKMFKRGDDGEMEPLSSSSNASVASQPALTSLASVSNASLSSPHLFTKTTVSPSASPLLPPSRVDDIRPSPSSSASSVSRVGSRLLEGWTMLAHHCPVCLNPIMQSRQGEMWCVECNVRAVDETQFDPNVHTAINRQEEKKKKQEEKKVEEIKVNKSEKSPNQLSLSVSGEEESVFSDARNVLLGRLRGATQRLEDTSSDNVETAERIMKHMREIMLTLETLKKK